MDPRFNKRAFIKNLKNAPLWMTAEIVEVNGRSVDHREQLKLFSERGGRRTTDRALNLVKLSLNRLYCFAVIDEDFDEAIWHVSTPTYFRGTKCEGEADYDFIYLPNAKFKVVSSSDKLKLLRFFRCSGATDSQDNQEKRSILRVEKLIF